LTIKQTDDKSKEKPKEKERKSCDEEKAETSVVEIDMQKTLPHDEPETSPTEERADEEAPMIELLLSLSSSATSVMKDYLNSDQSLTAAEKIKFGKDNKMMLAQIVAHQVYDQLKEKDDNSSFESVFEEKLKKSKSF